MMQWKICQLKKRHKEYRMKGQGQGLKAKIKVLSFPAVNYGRIRGKKNLFTPLHNSPLFAFILFLTYFVLLSAKDYV